MKFFGFVVVLHFQVTVERFKHVFALGRVFNYRRRSELRQETHFVIFS